MRKSLNILQLLRLTDLYYAVVSDNEINWLFVIKDIVYVNGKRQKVCPKRWTIRAMIVYEFI